MGLAPVEAREAIEHAKSKMSEALDIAADMASLAAPAQARKRGREPSDAESARFEDAYFRWTGQQWRDANITDEEQAKALAENLCDMIEVARREPAETSAAVKNSSPTKAVRLL
jgi:hypothetical protein